jgi:hypothetical protein
LGFTTALVPADHLGELVSGAAEGIRAVGVSTLRQAMAVVREVHEQKRRPRRPVLRPVPGDCARPVPGGSA